MRILLLTAEHPRVPGRTGGIGTFVDDASRALAGAGHEVHVLVCADGVRAFDHHDGVHLHARGLVSAVRPARGRAARLLAAAISCRWHARALGPFDIVESPEWQALAAAFTVARRAPVVISLQTPAAVISAHDHRSTRPSRAADALERATVRRADAVVSLSNLLVQELRRTGWLSAAQPVLISPPSIDLRPWATVPAAEHTEPVVLGIGRIEPRKGFDVLVDAVGLLQATCPDVRIELVGGDTQLGDGASEGLLLRQRAEGLGVHLTLHGERPRTDLGALLASSRVVALPSRFDSFNMAGLEALAAGRAVVCSDRVGLAELDDGTGAISVVPTGSPEALAAALAGPVDDPLRATAAGAAGRALAARLGPAGFVAGRERCFEALTGAG